MGAAPIPEKMAEDDSCDDKQEDPQGSPKINKKRKLSDAEYEDARSPKHTKSDIALAKETRFEYPESSL